MTGRRLFGRNDGLPLQGRAGHPELLFLLIPIAFVAFYVGLLVILPAKAQREIQQLLDELNMILDSSAAIAQTG